MMDLLLTVVETTERRGDELAALAEEVNNPAHLVPRPVQWADGGWRGGPAGGFAAQFAPAACRRGESSSAGHVSRSRDGASRT
jgi:hypothetical protein